MVTLAGMICAYVGVTAHDGDDDDLYIMAVDFFSCMAIDVDVDVDVDVAVKVDAMTVRENYGDSFDDCDE